MSDKRTMAARALEAEHWQGAAGSPCEHHTTGRRAWCLDCHEWCYPEVRCAGCTPDVSVAIEVLRQLPERMVAERTRRGLSYKAAAHVIGIAESAVYYIEHRQRDPGLVAVLRILRWLEDGHEWESDR